MPMRAGAEGSRVAGRAQFALIVGLREICGYPGKSDEVSMTPWFPLPSLPHIILAVVFDISRVCGFGPT